MASHQSHQYSLRNKTLATIQILHLDAGSQIQGQQLANASAPSSIHKDVINQAANVMKAKYALQGKKSTGNGFLQIDGAMDVEENQGLKNDSNSKEKRKGIRKRGWDEVMDTNTEEPQTVFYSATAGEQVHGDANRWRVKRAKVTELNNNKNTNTAIETKTKPNKANRAKSEGPSENIEEESLCESWEYETASEDVNEEGEDADDEDEYEDDYGEQAEDVEEEEEMKEVLVERVAELEQEQQQEAEFRKLVVKMSVEEKVEKWRETLLVRSSRGKRQRA